MKNGLYIKALGGQASILYVRDENTLFYKEGYRQINFKKSSEGKVERFIYENRRLKRNARKISDVVPEEKRIVHLDLATMENIVGLYEFEPLRLLLL